MKIIRFLFFILSIYFQLIVFSDIVKRTVNNFSLFLWLGSLLLLFIAFPFQKKENEKDKKISYPSFELKDFLLISLTILVGLAIRIFLMTNEYSFHNDEYLTAYFSYSLGDISKLDWFGIYPQPRDWIWQFPLFYFFFQKLFLNIFGITTLTIRLSNLPYLIIIFLSLFLITSYLYGKRAGFLSTLILVFFSPDLYLSRWALHFMSSTAFFLLATYLFLAGIRKEKKHYFALTGFVTGLCYMTYYSSWITALLLFFYALMMIVKKQISKEAAKNLLLSLGIFIYTISPLIIYDRKVENFLFTRINQVKLINGAWSPYKDLKIFSKRTFEILKEQTTLSIKSFYTDNIGGQGGYLFGKLALLDKITFIFFLIGIFNFLYKIFNKRGLNSIFILTIISVTFITGMVLTAPPPPFHRISIIFPIICLIIGTTLADIYYLSSEKIKYLGFLFLISTIALILISNILHFKKILAKDGPDDPDYPQIQQYLMKEGKRFFYVAAFESYGGGKIIFIRSKGTINSITKPLEEILKIIPENQTSFLVILYPDEEKIQKVKTKFPNAQIVHKYQKHALIKIN
jgi:4-amino-4-deoxy-L-arabinose transferase-like glycosyltransferase